MAFTFLKQDLKRMIIFKLIVLAIPERYRRSKTESGIISKPIPYKKFIDEVVAFRADEHGDQLFPPKHKSPASPRPGTM